MCLFEFEHDVLSLYPATQALHRGFVAPLTDVPVRLEPEFDLPACYRHTPQRLQAGYLGECREKGEEVRGGEGKGGKAAGRVRRGGYREREAVAAMMFCASCPPLTRRLLPEEGGGNTLMSSQPLAT